MLENFRKIEFVEYTILIVDDNLANLAILTTYLEDSGFEITVAQDGLEALRRIAYAPPDIILLDVLLPHIDGFEVCRRLKADKATQEIPVIFMTTLDNSESKIKGFNVGAVDYITKPLQQEEVLARVTTHLQIRDLTRRLQNANQELLRLNAYLETIVEERTKALQESEIRYREIVEGTDDLIIRINPTGNLTYVNQAARKIFGISERDCLGRLIFDFVHPDDKESTQATFAKCIDNQLGSVIIENRLVNQIKSEVYDMLWNVKLHYDTQGQVVKINAIMRDVTIIRESEKKQARLFQAVSQQRQQLRTLSMQLAQAEDTQRRHLARELHDRVGQKLTALSFDLDYVRRRLLTQLPGDPLLTRLEGSLELVKETTKTIRNVMADLRPPVLDDYGLLAALHWYSEQLIKRVPFIISVEGQSLKPRLPAPVESALFQIVQEALTNVAKYAQATYVTITLSERDKRVSLIISDDGLGFNVEQKLPSGSTEIHTWGLMIIIERTEAMGGQCHIKSTLGEGTQIIVEVPR